jgi:hypothetical protein
MKRCGGGFVVRARVARALRRFRHASRSMASGRDGGSNRRQADVPVARGRSQGEVLDLLVHRRRDKPCGTPAEAEAAQETRLRAEIADDRQAGVLRQTSTHLISRSTLRAFRAEAAAQRQTPSPQREAPT